MAARGLPAGRERLWSTGHDGTWGIMCDPIEPQAKGIDEQALTSLENVLKAEIERRTLSR